MTSSAVAVSWVSTLYVLVTTTPSNENSSPTKYRVFPPEILILFTTFWAGVFVVDDWFGVVVVVLIGVVGTGVGVWVFVCPPPNYVWVCVGLWVVPLPVLLLHAAKPKPAIPKMAKLLKTFNLFLLI